MPQHTNFGICYGFSFLRKTRWEFLAVEATTTPYRTHHARHVQDLPSRRTRQVWQPRSWGRPGLPTSCPGAPGRQGHEEPATSKEATCFVPIYWDRTLHYHTDLGQLAHLPCSSRTPTSRRVCVWKHIGLWSNYARSHHLTRLPVTCIIRW